MFIAMKLNEKPFNLIKEGKKTIEMRLFDEKRKHITVGDTIEFTNIANPKEKLEVKVVGVHIYPTFKELYRDYRKEELGYSENEVADPKDMEKYYPLQDQEKFCVVGIEIKV